MAAVAAVAAVATWSAPAVQAESAVATQAVKVRVLAGLGWRTGDGCDSAQGALQRCVLGTGFDIASQQQPGALTVTLNR
jgi:hypothetical protein